MKALELLYQYQQADEIAGGYMSKPIDEAIEEIINLKSKNEELSNILRDIDESLKELKGQMMAKVVELIEKDGMLYKCERTTRLTPKKWWQFFKKNKYEVVLKFKFIRATSPRLKILLEC